MFILPLDISIVRVVCVLTLQNAQSGTDDTKWMTPLKVKQAISYQTSGFSAETKMLSPLVTAIGKEELISGHHSYDYASSSMISFGSTVINIIPHVSSGTLGITFLKYNSNHTSYTTYQIGTYTNVAQHDAYSIDRFQDSTIVRIIPNTSSKITWYVDVNVSNPRNSKIICNLSNMANNVAVVTPNYVVIYDHYSSSRWYRYPRSNNASGTQLSVPSNASVVNGVYNSDVMCMLLRTGSGPYTFAVHVPSLTGTFPGSAIGNINNSYGYNVFWWNGSYGYVPSIKGNTDTTYVDVYRISTSSVSLYKSSFRLAPQSEGLRTYYQTKNYLVHVGNSNIHIVPKTFTSYVTHSELPIVNDLRYYFVEFEHDIYSSNCSTIIDIKNNLSFVMPETKINSNLTLLGYVSSINAMILDSQYTVYPIRKRMVFSNI